MGEVLILDHTYGVVIPGLGHGPYLCVGVTSDVILQDRVRVRYSVIISTCIYQLLSKKFLLVIVISIPSAIVADFFKVPLAWMIGPMIATSLIALKGFQVIYTSMYLLTQINLFILGFYKPCLLVEIDDIGCCSAQ